MRLKAFQFAVLALASSVAVPASAQDASGRFASRKFFGEKGGEQIYNAICAGCHMPDAGGAKGAGQYPALAKNTKLESSGYPLLLVVKGMHGMPAFGSLMTDQQIADVVNYVRTHFGNSYKDALTVADVKAVR